MRSKHPYASFVKHISFPILARYAGLKSIKRHLDLLEKSQFTSFDRIFTYQLEQLKMLLNHAYRTTSFYRRRFDACGFNPETFKHPDQLEKIPILTKQEIRDNLDEMMSDSYSSNEIHFSETGGTTGVKMKFYRDNDCLSVKEASLLRYERWGGWDIGDPLGIVWPAQQDYVGHWTKKAQLKNALYLRQVVFPAAILEENSIKNYLQQVLKKKPTLIRAFTNPLYEISKFILSSSIKITSVKGIITTGEPIYNHQREIIEEAFGCKVFDSYRSREAGPIAQECEAHQGLHINSENLFLEINSTGNISHGGESIGEVLVTDLRNYGMPLIRYNMNDLSSISYKKCPCGRGLPLLSGIQGRAASSFLTPDGKIVAAGALVLYLVDEAPGPVGQVQVIQETKNKITIRMTKDPLPSEAILNYQKQTIARLFGPEMNLNVELVEKIDREPSGKYLFTKCLINQ